MSLPGRGSQSAGAWREQQSQLVSGVFMTVRHGERRPALRRQYFLASSGHGSLSHSGRLPASRSLRACVYLRRVLVGVYVGARLSG